MKNPRRGKNEILYGKETPRGHHYGGRTARLIRTMRGTLFVDWDGLDDDPGMAQVHTEAAGRAFVDAWMADRTLRDSLQAAADAQRAAIKAVSNPRGAIPSPFQKGARVQLHPATDEWMQGDRYGTVTGHGAAKIELDRASGATVSYRPVRVKLDRSGRSRVLHPDNLTLLDEPSRTVCAVCGEEAGGTGSMAGLVHKWGPRDHAFTPIRPNPSRSKSARTRRKDRRRDYGNRRTYRAATRALFAGGIKSPRPGQAYARFAHYSAERDARRRRPNPGDGWRSYGPGKFDSMVDSFLWASTADGGDEELGDVADFGYYVLLNGHLLEAAEQGSIIKGEEITPDEIAELKTRAAVIMSENADGFVSATYYDTQKEAWAAWNELELEYRKWAEGNEENPRRGRGRTHNPRTYTGAQYATPSAMKMVREWLGPPPYAKADVERVAKYMRDTLRVGGIRDCRALVIGAIQDAGLAVENPRGQRNPGGPRIVYNKLLGGWYVVVGPHQTPLDGRFNSKAEAQAWLSGRRTSNPRRDLGVPDKHQLKIARATLKMSDAMARVMGGPTKAEARAIIRRLTGSVPRENPRAGSELARAKRTSEMWHEFPASKVTRMKGPPRVIPRHLVRLGEMTRLDYRSNKYEGRTRTYTHAFRRPRPVLATDPDGKNLHIVGGNVKVTADGLVN